MMKTTRWIASVTALLAVTGCASSEPQAPNVSITTELVRTSAETADENGGQAPTQQAEATSESERLICKTIGDPRSRLAKKEVCATKDQWDRHYAQTRSDQDDLTRMSQRGS